MTNHYHLVIRHCWLGQQIFSNMVGIIQNGSK